MSVYCAAKNAKPADRKTVAQLFGGAGAVLELPERHFDAVTALSGSGPAFVAYVMQAMTRRRRRSSCRRTPRACWRSRR
jgi:pyrroline-5-carboxylate reductase